jgi:hypothetical protein
MGQGCGLTHGAGFNPPLISNHNQTTMNTAQLIKDAILMLETIEQCNSPAFKATAARQLVDIAVEIAAQYYVPAVTPEPEQPDEPAEPRPVIDLAMKYRTRDGREVTELHIRDNLRFPIWGVVEGETRNWTKEGFFMDRDKQHGCDLIPTGEPV